MSGVIASRRASRMKKKSLIKDGNESCLKMSQVVTQRTAGPFAAVKAVSKRPEAFHSNSELQTFLDTFSNEIEEGEQLLLKQIDNAWKRKDLNAMFQLIKTNNFSHVTRKKVLQFWDWGHYHLQSSLRNKPLTPLARFRIREKFLPPENICPNGRKKATLPKEATKILRNWLAENNTRPYPSRETKAALAGLTGLTIMQVNTWFANYRRRMRGRRRKDDPNDKSTPQPWQAPVLSTVITSTPTTFPSCSGVCSCPVQLPQLLAPTSSLGSNLPALWSEMSANTRSFIDWPASHTATVGSTQYLSSSVVALGASVWEPELQYCGLHAAAQILVDMAGK